MPSNPPHGRDLTPAQALIFCRAAQLGVACGLTHRYEWLVNALRAPVSYETIGVYTEELYEAFLMFEKGTAGDPYEDEELSAMDLPGFISRINAWYARGEKHA